MSESRAVESEDVWQSRISELTRELERERAARQASERAVIATVDSEQQRLAQLLHDTLSQSLNAARIYARVARDTITRSHPDATTVLVKLEEVIHGAADEFQGLTRWLRPARLDGSDLTASIADLSQLAARAVPCTFRGSGAALDAELDSQAELLRIAQLALHSLVRYCQVKALEIDLARDEQHLVLEIRAAGAQPLPSDQEALLDRRARALGGNLTVQYDAAHGCTCSCRLPKRR